MNSEPPSRASSQRQRLLDRLRQAGTRGVLAAELYDDLQCRFGRSPRKRVSESRAIGHKIVREWESKVDFRHTLIEETQAPRSLPDYVAQKKFDWYERQTGRSRPGASPNLGFLFDGARSRL